MGKLAPIGTSAFSFSFLREELFSWAMSFAKFYLYELKGHMSHPQGRSSFSAPKTTPPGCSLWAYFSRALCGGWVPHPLLISGMCSGCFF